LCSVVSVAENCAGEHAAAGDDRAADDKNGAHGGFDTAMANNTTETLVGRIFLHSRTAARIVYTVLSAEGSGAANVASRAV